MTNRRWCATVVVITVDTSSGTPVRYEWQPGRGCGTIAARNIAAVSFGCPTAAGIAGVVRGRPDRIVIVGADGRERAVQVRRIRDRYQAGTFFALRTLATRLPAQVIRIDADQRSLVSRVPSLDGPCT